MNLHGQVSSLAPSSLPLPPSSFILHPFAFAPSSSLQKEAPLPLEHADLLVSANYFATRARLPVVLPFVMMWPLSSRGLR